MRQSSVRALIASFAMLCLAPGAAGAATFEVTRKSDPDPGQCRPRDCSLREAVLAAADNSVADRIVLPSRRGAYRLTQTGTAEDAALDGDLDVNDGRVKVMHPGRGTATIDASGAGERAFQAFAPLALTKLTITGGLDGGGGALVASEDVSVVKSVFRANESTNVGGAIDMEDDGKLRIVDSVLRGNRAQNTAGAIRDGSGKVTIVRSKLVGNEAVFDGGAMRLSSSPGKIVGSKFARNESTDAEGGAIQTDLEGPLVIRKTTFDRNRSQGSGGAIFAEGSSKLTIASSTLSRNRTGDDGGGLFVDNAPASIVNSTFSGNDADTHGGGIHAQDGADVALNAVTIARNRAAADDMGLILLGGGGIYRDAAVGFELANSLIGLNTLGASGTLRNDCYGDAPFESQGGNVSAGTPDGGGPCDGLDAPSDRSALNPKIAELRRNGGPTQTIALKRGSVAIGNARKATAPKRDQRGSKRDGDPDSGAYER